MLDWNLASFNLYDCRNQMHRVTNYLYGTLGKFDKYKTLSVLDMKWL